MFRKVVFQLNVKLDEAEHSDGHADGLEDFHPDVREGWTKAVLAVNVADLSDDCHDGEEDANEAVLENADPNDLVFC